MLLTIAIGSSLAAYRFNDLATEVGKEKELAHRSLLLAHQNEAHAHTTSKRPGQRLKALDAIRKAVELLPQVEHDEQRRSQVAK